MAFKQYKANLGIWVQSKEIGAADVFLLILLTCWGLIILLPFINAVAISFASYKGCEIAQPLSRFLDALNVKEIYVIV